MRLSFSTNAFTRTSVGEAVERIAACGYAGVEILADAPHLYAPDVSEAEVARLGQRCEAAGLTVANVNANTAVGYYGRAFWEPLFEPSLAHPDDSGRRWRIDYTKRCIDCAAALGARNVSVTSGRMVPGVDPERSRELLIASLGELLPYAEARGVRIGIEYEPGLLIECCSELGELLTAVGSESLGANLDLGHSHVLGEDPQTVISCLAPRLFHIHIEDIRGRKHFHLIPGLGEIDFKQLLELLRVHRYEGFVTVELYTYPHMAEEAARRAFAHLAPLMPPEEKR